MMGGDEGKKGKRIIRKALTDAYGCSSIASGAYVIGHTLKSMSHHPYL